MLDVSEERVVDSGAAEERTLGQKVVLHDFISAVKTAQLECDETILDSYSEGLLLSTPRLPGKDSRTL